MNNLNYDMFIASADANAAIANNVAENTRLQDEKIRYGFLNDRKLWDAYCLDKGFVDGNLVHEAKIWLYVSDTLVKTNPDGSLSPRLSKSRRSNNILK